MRRSLLAVIAVMALCAAACVEVPDTIRAQFAAPGPQDRSNYRPGSHGTALPIEEPAVKAATPEAAPADAGAPASPTATVDGGVS